jgi:hypothetical protein
MSFLWRPLVGWILERERERERGAVEVKRERGGYGGGEERDVEV